MNICKAYGTTCNYIKPHGALYHEVYIYVYLCICDLKYCEIISEIIFFLIFFFFFCRW